MPSDKDDTETSDHLRFCGKEADEQELRGHEMDLLGYLERARWVRRCGNGTYQHPCNVRGWCPRCSKRIAVEQGGRGAAGIARMTNRLVGLFMMPVRWDPCEQNKRSRIVAFKAALKMFRDALKEIRRRGAFRPVLGGVEFMEFELSEHGRSWNLHAHVIVDAVALDRVEVEAAFKQLTKGRGWFSFPKENEPKTVAPEDINRSAMYFAKADSWSPAPGVLSLAQLNVLQHAVKGVQLVTMWGTAAAPKGQNGEARRPKPKLPTRTKRVPFHLCPDDLALVEAAIKCASEVTHSDVRSSNLALVCMSFLATNDFGIHDETQRRKLVAQVERLVGFKFIVWDPDLDAIVHGYDTLRMLAKAAQGEATSDPQPSALSPS